MTIVVDKNGLVVEVIRSARVAREVHEWVAIKEEMDALTDSHREWCELLQVALDEKAPRKEISSIVETILDVEDKIDAILYSIKYEKLLRRNI